MENHAGEEANNRTDRRWNNLSIFLVCWVAVFGLMFLVVRPSESSWPLNQYNYFYLALAVLAVGLVVVFGVLPGTRFGAPGEVGTRDEQKTERITQMWGAVELGQARVLAQKIEVSPGESPSLAAQPGPGPARKEG